jgi:hypothetical protein
VGGIDGLRARAASVAAAPVVRSYLAGLTIAPNGGFSNFGVAAGQCADSTNVDMLNLTGLGLNKTTSAWAVGNNNGALDTGAISTTTPTWYSVFLIKRTDTGVVDVLISLSATSPTLPSPYTLFRRIGSLLTDTASHWLQYYQFGDEFLWAGTFGDINISNLSATSALFTLTVPLGVQVWALFRGSMSSATAGVNVLISPPDQITEATSSPLGNVSLTNANTTTSVRAPFSIRTNTAGQVRAVASAGSTSFTIDTYGWVDRRGRDN